MSLATFPLESVPVVEDLSDADRSAVYPMESEITIPAFLTSVGEPGLSLTQPIPIEIHCLESGEFLAAFREANVAMSGETFLEAVQRLSADLCDMFQTFSQEETNLGPAPARQLEILKRYITAV